MAKKVNASDGFTLRDLTSEDGIILEIGDECAEMEEEFPYSPGINLSNEEVLNLINMDDFEDKGDENNEGGGTVTLFGTSFDTLKTKMTDIFGNGKVMKLVKQKGVGEVVPNDAQVTISYIGYFEYRDEPFDSSFTRGGSETFCLNQGRLIAGLEIGIASMRKHEIAVFIIHPDLAYGVQGCPPRIPPNEEILFTVHLIDYVDNGAVETFETLTNEEKKKFVNVSKRVYALISTAKENVKKDKIKQAIREYERAVSSLELAQLNDEEEESAANKLLTRALSNLAVCYNKVNMPRRVCTACNRAPIKTAKIHFNHGRALLKMGEYDRAMEHLQLSLKMEPNNEDTIKEIRLVNEKQRKYLEMEKQLWGNCLQTKKESKETSVFQTAAREMCEMFVRDSQLLRQPLPDGLTPEEDKCIREQAAALGLFVTTHERYGKEKTYLNKRNY